MGNSSAKKTHENALRGGPLDSRNMLQTTYEDIMKLDEVKNGLKEMFRDLRIMVVGRSGSGKTTLIRLIIGDNGPQTVSQGKAGIQDINQEWHHPDPELPLIFHDSNGIDVKGEDRLITIRKFVEQHERSGEFSQKIHLVWYVFSAVDTRFLDDVDLMEVLDNSNIPLLLIMTFNDCESMVKDNVTESNLKTLLARINDAGKREKVKRTMVRVGNRVQLIGNTVTGTKDVEGLKNLINISKSLIGKKFELTWSACQVINLYDKLEASAKVIVKFKKWEVFSTYAVGALPVVHQAQLAFMFIKVLKSLCMIWRVPENCRKAMFKTVFLQEGLSNCLLRNLFHNMLSSLGLLATAAATVLTYGVASPAIVVVLLGSGLFQVRATPTLLMSYSCLILGTILYIRSTQNITHEKWDEGKSMEEYIKYCEELATATNYTKELLRFATESRSAWETAVHTKRQKHRVKKDFIDFFHKVMLDRKKSLFSVMQQTDNDEAGTSSPYHPRVEATTSPSDSSRNTDENTEQQPEDGMTDYQI